MQPESWGMAIFSGLLMGLAITSIGPVISSTLRFVSHNRTIRTRPRTRGLHILSGLVAGTDFILFERSPRAHGVLIIILAIAFALIGWRQLKRH